MKIVNILGWLVGGIFITSLICLILEAITLSGGECLKSHKEMRHEDYVTEMVPHIEIVYNDIMKMHMSQMTMRPETVYRPHDYEVTVCDDQIPRYTAYDWVMGNGR
jgi:hypothetical protein